MTLQECLRQPDFQEYGHQMHEERGNCQGRSCSLYEFMQIVTSAVRIDARRRRYGTTSKQIFRGRASERKSLRFWSVRTRRPFQSDVVKACWKGFSLRRTSCAPNAAPSGVVSRWRNTAVKTLQNLFAARPRRVEFSGESFRMERSSAMAVQVGRRNHRLHQIGRLRRPSKRRNDDVRSLSFSHFARLLRILRFVRLTTISVFMRCCLEM